MKCEESKHDCLRASGDTTAIDEEEDILVSVASPIKLELEGLAENVKGNYLEERLADAAVRDSYFRHSEDLQRYKKTTAYKNAKTTRANDIMVFKKNITKYGGKHI